MAGSRLGGLLWLIRWEKGPKVLLILPQLLRLSTLLSRLPPNLFSSSHSVSSQIRDQTRKVINSTFSVIYYAARTVVTASPCRLDSHLPSSERDKPVPRLAIDFVRFYFWFGAISHLYERESRLLLPRYLHHFCIYMRMSSIVWFLTTFDLTLTLNWQ